MNLQSEDYGKHMMGVEDLLQKHSIIESDIAIVGARVEAINTQAQTFVDSDFPDVEGSYAHIEFSSDALVICLITWLRLGSLPLRLGSLPNHFLHRPSPFLPD